MVAGGAAADSAQLAPCRLRMGRGRFRAMSTLAEIEAAADALPQEQKEKLFLFLATRLRAGGGELPPSREFSLKQMEQWIADDEAGYRRFLAGQ